MKKDIKYFIFRQNIKHYTKNKYIIHLLNFLELIMIYVPLMNISFYLSVYKTTKKKSNNYFLIFSPYHHLHTLYDISSYFRYTFLSLITFLFILYHILFSLQFEFKNYFLNDIYINLYNILFCRAFSICSVDVFIYNFINFCYNEKNIVFPVLCLIFLVIVIYFISDNIINLYVISTGNINYPVNSTMRNSDIYFFYLKILLSFCRNISDVSVSKDDSILFFLNVITLVYFFIGYIYFIFSIYFNPIYSIIIKNNIQLRLFFTTFSSLMIIFTLLFHDKNFFMYFIVIIGTIILCFIISFDYNPINLSLKDLNFLNYQNQILLILNLMQTKDKDLYSKIYNEKIKFHFLFCRKCVFCKFLQKYREENPKDSFDFNTLHKLFLTLIEKENKRIGHHKPNYIHDVYDLLSNLKENACYNLKIHYLFKKLIKRYKKLGKKIEI